MTLNLLSGLPKLFRPRRPAKAAPLPAVLDLRSGSVPLVVRRHPRARRLSMRLQPGALSIAVTVPPRTPARTILAFIERHRDWAESRLDAASRGRIVVADGAVLPFRGGAVRIVHAPVRRASRFEAGPDGECRLLVGGNLAHLPRRAMDALKREARADLQAAVERHAASVGLKPAALALKDTRSRWGSCTAGRRLAFSWRVVMAPPHVLDYLCAHEVAHFVEMNHGAGFWALCRTLCPGMDEGRDWLKRHGASLHTIDFG